MRKDLFPIIILGVLIVGIAFWANSDKTVADPAEDQRPVTHQSVEFENKQDISQLHLRDVETLYAEDDPYDVVTMYLTVSEGNESDGTNHTWKEVNSYSAYYYDDLNIDRYKVAGLIQVGDEEGPVQGELGYGLTVPNATVQIRGQTSTRNAQKNYKIELVDNSKGWRGQRTIALNKHQSDGLRFRNKLAYDTMKDIPQLMALRTQFVHLYVKDLTSGSNKFEDYGLYTQVEQPNKTALRAHGLDQNGYLYKINFFEFYRYEEIIRLAEDPLYDQSAFEELLEIKGKKDHSKLISMLEAVNNYSLTSDQVLNQYFDRENLAYWMAFMILTGNADTESRNMYIYSPLNSETWYIYPWDQDAMMKRTEEDLQDYVDAQDWQTGVSNYWGNVLFQRALLSDSFREQLDAAITDLLANYLNSETLLEKMNKYAETVKPYIYSMPDINHAPIQKGKYDEVLEETAYEIYQNYDRYLETLESPMPFFIGVPSYQNGVLTLNWNIAYDFHNEDITYHVILDTDYSYRHPIYEANDLILPGVSFEANLKPGMYFLHVDATNTSGKTTNCFDYYVNNNGKIYGTYGFYVLESGEIIPLEVDE